MSKTREQLMALSNDEIIALMESGEGFVDAPVDEEMLARNWERLKKRLDLKPKPMDKKKDDTDFHDRAFLIGFVLGCVVTVLVYVLAQIAVHI